MTQEDKELLLKDLCARLPYGLKCQIQEGNYTYSGTLCRLEVDSKNGHLLDFVESINGLGCQVYLSEIKPYLYPLSSITEEQLKDLGTYYAKDSKNIIDDAIKSLESSLTMYRVAHVCFNTLEWYNKNHFDYRGLIEKGLAIDATGLNIY